MVKNIGDVDRIVRIVAGIVLVLVGLLVPMTSVVLQVLLLAIGVVLLLTAAFRWSPVYSLLKFSTNK